MKEDRVLALGFFDGVHRGHAALLARAREQADCLGCKAAVLTFSNHPDELVFGRPTPLINTLEDREWLMKALHGMDEVLSIPFDRALMETPWETFVEELLVRRLRTVHVVCGHDFTFGHRGLGNPQRLAAKCGQLGLGCDVIPPVTCHGHTVSSTEIRGLLEAGDLDQANHLLGHRHFLTGAVVHGAQLGRRLGTPTANLALPKGVLAPAFGVYATEVTLADGSTHIAVTNVGVRPTVGGDRGILMEPWLLDYQGDLYGQTIRITLCKFLRREQRFADLDALRAQILADSQAVRAFFGAPNGG